MRHCSYRAKMLYRLTVLRRSALTFYRGHIDKVEASHCSTRGNHLLERFYWFVPSLDHPPGSKLPDIPNVDGLLKIEQIDFIADA